MISKGKLSQIKTAYKAVFDKREEKENNLLRILNEIVFNAEKYPFEDADLQSARFTQIEDVTNSDSIMEYLAKVPQAEFDGAATMYAKLFTIGKKYCKSLNGNTVAKPQPVSHDNAEDAIEETISVVEEIGSEPEVELVEPIKEEPAEVAQLIPPVAPKVEVETIKSTSTHNNKEEIIMSNPINPIAELQAQAQGAGVMVNTNVTETSKVDREAARKVIQDTQMDRIAYSTNAVLENALIVSIDRVSRAVKGTASKGTITDARKSLTTFKIKTGFEEIDGVITFSKLYDGESQDNARKMYDILVEACDNPNLELNPYFGKPNAEATVSIKAFVLREPSGNTAKVPFKDLPNTIMDNAFLYLNTNSTSNAQVQLDTSSVKGGKAPKKTYTVKIANRKSMLEDVNFCVSIKKITDQVDEKSTGFKSELAVTCKGALAAATGAKAKKIVWRIPLNVEQYKVEITAGNEDLFKNGVGSSVAPISTADSGAIDKIINKLSAIIAAESVKGSDELGQTTKEALSTAKKEAMEEQADATKALLSSTAPDVSDFE